MARSRVKEKHAPDRTLSGGTSSLPIDSGLDPACPSGTQATPNRPLPPSPVVSVSYVSPRMEEAITSPEQSQNFDDLQSYFFPDFGNSWQPAETTFQNFNWFGGLRPWAPGIGSGLPDPLGANNNYDLMAPHGQCIL